MPSLNRFSRQESIVPVEKKTPVTIIGVGAIGLQLAKFMASMGIPQIRLIDFDVVEDTNITTQGYTGSQLGLPKVEAARDSIHAIDADIKVIAENDRWRPKTKIDGVVFCCVDSIKARECIWKGIKNKVDFFCDARMLGEVFHVYAWIKGAPHEDYEQTLFAEEETIAGQCTAAGTIYCAGMAAGAMCHQYTRWIRGVLPPDVSWSCALLSSELSVISRDFVAPPEDTGMLVKEVIVEKPEEVATPVEEEAEEASAEPEPVPALADPVDDYDDDDWDREREEDRW